MRELPGWVKSGGKFALALAFTYHFFNGVKHLTWDLGFGLTNKKLFGRFAWIVAGCSVDEKPCIFPTLHSEGDHH